MKKLAVLFVVLMFAGAANAQEIKWISFEQAIEKSKQNPKKILVDVYTDWCKWCKVMDNKTFSNPVIVDYINKNYYAVKFDAESDGVVNFKGHEFKNQKQSNRHPHDLAIALLQGKMSYPSYVFMNEKQELITVLKGFLEPKDFEPYITYIDQSLYEKNIPFQDYAESFDSSFN